MAMEVMKPAASTYQGSSSGAAKSAKSAEVDSKTEAAKSDIERVQQPIKPVSEDASGQGGASSKDGGRQTNKQLQEAVEKMKKNMIGNTEPVFGIHEGTNRVTIKIVDKETKDIVKEYPPEETLDMIQKVWEMAGIVVDEKM